MFFWGGGEELYSDVDPLLHLFVIDFKRTNKAVHLSFTFSPNYHVNSVQNERCYLIFAFVDI